MRFKLFNFHAGSGITDHAETVIHEDRRRCDFLARPGGPGQNLPYQYQEQDQTQVDRQFAVRKPSHHEAIYAAHELHDRCTT